ncbi:MAG: NADH-quinone oxidoreductase subunit H [Eggerthellaceae bacterium]|nr:NADH-quinone oxidoreductase subunit H [Eggerthellaceae bacterium]
MDAIGFLAPLLGCVAFLIFAPIIGCLLAGIDRIISAKMQGRVGPPLLQPYYDVRKLFEKERVTVNGVQDAYVICALIFAVIAGGIFFSGGNLLMCVFVITLSSLFFIIAAYSSRSPYSEVGAARETLQVMSYEPMVLLFAVGFYMATAAILPFGDVGTFDIAAVLMLDRPVIVYIWPVFLGLMFILTIKLRKSPFDLSMSHHAHQEIVRGMTTEMSGSTLGMVEILHWMENVLFLGWIGIFFVWGGPLTILIGIAAALIAYFLEILIDNNFARVKWQFMLKASWCVALIAGGINLAVLAFI